MILERQFFQISPKFCKETRPTVPQKPRKKKVMPSIILIIKEQKELYAKIYYSNQDTININHALLQIFKQELAKILQFKGETFHMKATIQKSEKETTYTLFYSYVKADQ